MMRDVKKESWEGDNCRRKNTCDCRLLKIPSMIRLDSETQLLVKNKKKINDGRQEGPDEEDRNMR